MSLLEVRNLKKYFPAQSSNNVGRKLVVKALDGVSLTIEAGETFGLVGESGCGKSTLGHCVLRLLEPNSGEILLDGQDLTMLKGKALRQIRRHLQMVFQDPVSSLNPRMTVLQILEEPFRIHRLCGKEECLSRIHDLLDAVGLDKGSLAKYPYEFSGGQRQRISIARALALKPKLIVADEPVSALDVSIQAQIVNLFQDLQERFQLTYLFISHSLPIVEHISSRIGVMYLGKLAEVGTAEEIFQNPRHPYTQILLDSVPRLDGSGRKALLGGEMPSALNPPAGCRFHTRCPLAVDRCRVEEPRELNLSSSHRVWCHLAEPAASNTQVPNS
ncbi:MAG: oligopeptide/dipeptide ABC transporter ATP-binding protein [Terriglobia bacterium]